MQTYYGSRTKASIGLSACIAFAALGIWLIGQPSIKTFVAGWLTIIFFGAISPLWMAAVFRPNLLTITDEGFSVRQAAGPTSRRSSWTGRALPILLSGHLRIDHGRLPPLRHGWANQTPTTVISRLVGRLRRPRSLRRCRVPSAATRRQSANLSLRSEAD